MICPKCGANMTLRKGTCAKCGFDIEVNQKTRKISCYFYNLGLEKAKIRDLSGAVEMLNRALKISKKNVDARNLLGLVYFEMGETVQAIHHWIISKSYLEGGNPAEHYLSILQANPTKLDNLNVAIRKYNAALELANNGGDDLAIIQLKKVVSLNPKFVRAWQLLALLYMRAGENALARRCLKRTLAVDIANTDSIRYLKEIRMINRMERGLQVTIPEPGEEMDLSEQSDEQGSKSKRGILPSFQYEEDKPDYRVFISLVVGIFLGIMVLFFMVVPGVKMGMREEFKQTQAGYGEEQSQYLADIDALEKENQSLQSKLELQELELDGLEDEVEELAGKVGGVNMFNMMQYYLKLTSQSSVSKVELYVLQKRLKAVSEEELSNSSAQEIYDRVVKDYPDALTVTMTSTELYQEGAELYAAERYSQALEFFQFSYEKSADNEKNLYYLARTYHLLKDTENAKKHYNEYMERFPEGEYYDTANRFVSGL